MSYIGSKQISEAGPQAEHLEQTENSFYFPLILWGRKGNQEMCALKHSADECGRS